MGATPKAKLPIDHYLRENFYIATSGNFRMQTLTEVMTEVSADRVLYAQYRQGNSSGQPNCAGEDAVGSFEDAVLPPD